MTRRVATTLAIALAATTAWGHTFPAVRTVVVQIEPCEVSVLIGFRPQSGEPTAAVLARVANSPKGQPVVGTAPPFGGAAGRAQVPAVEALRDVMSAYAVAPLTVSLDGRALDPSAVSAKVGVEPGGARPIVVVLVTYAISGPGSLGVSSKDPRTTRISWGDRDSGRVDLTTAPAQDTWFPGVASFLLTLRPTGASACATSKPSASPASRATSPSSLGHS